MIPAAILVIVVLAAAGLLYMHQAAQIAALQRQVRRLTAASEDMREFLEMHVFGVKMSTWIEQRKRHNESKVRPIHDRSN